MPYVTNGNIYAPVMMLAEKAADLIAGKAPLAAQHSEFYRHGVSPLEKDGTERNGAGTGAAPAAGA
jgi:choline dehydrogenase